MPTGSVNNISVFFFAEDRRRIRDIATPSRHRSRRLSATVRVSFYAKKRDGASSMCSSAGRSMNGAAETAW